MSYAPDKRKDAHRQMDGILPWSHWQEDINVENQKSV